MRKRTIRSGMNMLLAAMLLIILFSFFHGGMARLMFLSPGSEQRLLSMGMFAAAALGGYAVVMSVLGLVLPSDYRDAKVRIMPVFVLLLCSVAFFFYLFFASFNRPPEEQPMRPGTTITI